MTLDSLSKLQTFNRNDLRTIMTDNNANATDSTVNHMIIHMLHNGDIIRIGRNLYTLSGSKKKYMFPYSETVVLLAEEISSAHPFLDFRLFELTQLNEFVNHQIAHNIIFLSVEGGFEEDVFSTLWEKHAGSVMLKPGIDELYRYMTDDTIVIEKMPSESPKGEQKFWNTRLEKMLVDIAVDKIINKIVYAGEYPAIFHDAVSKYAIDKNLLTRYARRRGAIDKFRKFIREDANLSPEELDI